MEGLGLLPCILFVYVGALPTELAYETTIGTTGRLIGEPFLASCHFRHRNHYGDYGDRADYWGNRNTNYGDYYGGYYGDRHYIT